MVRARMTMLFRPAIDVDPGLLCGGEPSRIEDLTAKAPVDTRAASVPPAKA